MLGNHRILIIGDKTPYRNFIDNYRHKKYAVDTMPQVTSDLKLLRKMYNYIVVHQPFHDICDKDFTGNETDRDLFEQVMKTIRGGVNKRAPVVVVYHNLPGEDYEYLSHLRELGADDVLKIDTMENLADNLQVIIENVLRKE